MKAGTYQREPEAKKVLVAISKSLLNEVDEVAKAEYRTRSDLIREAMRRYIGNFAQHSRLKLVNKERSDDV